MLKIFIDTNMFLVPGQFGVDIFSEFDRLIDRRYELYTLESVLEELESLIDKSDRDSKNAKLALDMINSEGIKIVGEGDNYVDERLMYYAKEDNTVIATNDGELIRKLKEDNTDIIRLRKNKKLVIEGKKYL
ncbi:MAG: PIN domain-containing protein [Candidatus Aenigmatarchaeota archaeon]